MSGTLDELTFKAKQVSDTYAKLFDIRRDDDWFLLKLQEELGEMTAEYLRCSGRGRRRSEGDAKEALENEAADVLASLLLFIDHHRLDIDTALQRKWFSYLPQGSSKPL